MTLHKEIMQHPRGSSFTNRIWPFEGGQPRFFTSLLRHGALTSWAVQVNNLSLVAEVWKGSRTARRHRYRKIEKWDTREEQVLQLHTVKGCSKEGKLRREEACTLPSGSNKKVGRRSRGSEARITLSGCRFLSHVSSLPLPLASP